MKSIVSSGPSATTRQAPWRSESGNGAPPNRSREPPRRLPWVAAGDVEVEDRLPEQRVAHGAADDPGLLAGKDLADALVVDGHPTHHPLARARTLVSSPVAIS